MIEKIRAFFTGGNVKAQAARGGLWLSGATAFDQGSRFVRQIILARILLPEDFGLMTLVVASTTAFESLTEVGVRQCVIQSPNGKSNEFLNAAWWFSTGRGAFLYAVGLAAAPFVCRYYNTPELLHLLQAAFVVMIFRGLVSPGMYVLEKDLKFSRWVVVTQGAGFAAVLASIAAALVLRNVWALVLGMVLEAVLRTGLSFVVCPFAPKLAMDREAFREIRHFAQGMFGLPVLMMVFNQLPVFVLGKMTTMDELGRFNIAYNLARTPLVIFGAAVMPLLLPALSRFRDDREKLRRALLDAVKTVVIIAVPVTVFMIVCAEPLMVILYTDKYAGTGMVLALSTAGTLVMMVNSCVVTVFMGIGMPRLHRWYSGLRAAILAATIVPAIYLWGMNGAPVAILAALVGVFVIQQMRLERLVGISGADVAKAMGGGAMLAALTLVGTAAGRAIAGSGIQATVIGAAVCAVATAVGASRIVTGRTKAE